MSLMKKALPALSRVLLLVMIMGLAASPLCAAAAENDWYMQHSQALLDEMKALMDDPGYIKGVTTMKEIADAIDQWRQALEKQQPKVHVFPLPTLEQVLKMTGEENALSSIQGMGEVARKRVERAAYMVLINQQNSASATQSSMPSFLMAGNAVNVNALLEVPEGFENKVVVYAYDTFTISVAFLNRDLAVSANAYISTTGVLEALQSIQ